MKTALTTCTACQREISRLTPRCPQCGEPTRAVQRYRRRLIATVAILVGLAAFFIIAGISTINDLEESKRRGLEMDMNAKRTIAEWDSQAARMGVDMDAVRKEREARTAKR